MIRRTSLSLRIVALSFLLASFASAHTVITYPGWRGNNLHTNGTTQDTNGLVVAPSGNGTDLYHPYGMQWEYPCKLKSLPLVFFVEATRADRTSACDKKR
jgi:hypothetical protein